MICLTSKPRQSFFIYGLQNKENSFTEKELFKETGDWRIIQKTKRRLFTAPATVINEWPNNVNKKAQ